jgi:hypothetical protein
MPLTTFSPKDHAGIPGEPRGTAMSIASRIMNLTACALASGLVTCIYVEICVRFAVDCF